MGECTVCERDACSNTFPQNRGKNKRFCSAECRESERKRVKRLARTSIELTCEGCGKSFHENDMYRGSARRFCYECNPVRGTVPRARGTRASCQYDGCDNTFARHVPHHKYCREHQSAAMSKARAKARIETGRVCASCQSVFHQLKPGPQRKYCYECSPENCKVRQICGCVCCGKEWEQYGSSNKCGKCRDRQAAQKKCADSMKELRKTLKRNISDIQTRQRIRARDVYLECKCIFCGNVVWRDAHSVGKHERTCGMKRCRHKFYARTERAFNRVHRRRTVQQDGDIISRKVLWERDGGICHICGLPADNKKWEVDHVVPIVLGGSHTWDNVAVAHPLCNKKKGGRMLNELRLPVVTA